LRILFFLLIFILIVNLTAEIIRIELPDKSAVKLKHYTKFDFPEINESSALVKSRFWENLYWTLNDSGDEARIFPVNRQGNVYRAEWYDSTQAGIRLPEAVNVDWEDIATDDSGNLYIAACGNNNNTRRDLAVYILKDPYPQFTSQTTITHKIRFHYPDQIEFPPEKMNYDCEAIFIAYDKIHLLTKHRSDTNTCLYRFDEIDPNRENTPLKLGCFNIQGMVTAADCSSDSRDLVVLTYNAIWLFESETGDYFTGKVSWLPIIAGQCEAICFDKEFILLSNEEGFIYEISRSDLIEVN